jgi:hypothetical protein
LIEVDWSFASAGWTGKSRSSVRRRGTAQVGILAILLQAVFDFFTRRAHRIGMSDGKAANENGTAADIGADDALPLEVRSRRRSISIILHDHGSRAIRVRCQWQLDLPCKYDSRGSGENVLA